MRKLLMIFGVAGFLFAGCSSNEVEEYNSLSPDVIKITASTTRATVNDYSALQASTEGIRVYGKLKTANAWYSTDGRIDGTNNYWYSGTAWAWKNSAPTWPTDISTTKTMQFFAMYPAAAVTPTASAGAANSDASITGSITIQPTAETQVDILAARSLSVSEKPASGYLPLTFNHILSKVNVGITAGKNATVYVQSVAIKNVRNTNTYNFVLGTWANLAANQKGTASYDYLTTTVPTGVSPLVVSGGDGSTATAIFDETTDPTNYAERNLILMPQPNTTIWNKTDDLSGAYIELVYRFTKTSSEIGYTDASEYVTDNPKTFVDDGTMVDGSWTYSTIENYTNANPGNNTFFIKVGFPLSTTGTAFTWEAGKGYTYNLPLGTSTSIDGSYADDTYYDNEGNDTGIKIKDPDGGGGDVIIGEDVTKNTIMFQLIVDDFDTKSSTL